MEKSTKALALGAMLLLGSACDDFDGERAEKAKELQEVDSGRRRIRDKIESRTTKSPTKPSLVTLDIPEEGCPLGPISRVIPPRTECRTLKETTNLKDYPDLLGFEESDKLTYKIESGSNGGVKVCGTSPQDVEVIKGRTLSKREIESTLHRRIKSLSSCYGEVGASLPNGGNKLGVNFKINLVGKVEDANITLNTVDATPSPEGRVNDFEKCVIGKVESWRFIADRLLELCPVDVVVKYEDQQTEGK